MRDYVTVIYQQPQLDNCPGCGGQAVFQVDDRKFSYRVACADSEACGLSTPWYNSVDVVAAIWNKRAGGVWVASVDKEPPVGHLVLVYETREQEVLLGHRLPKGHDRLGKAHWSIFGHGGDRWKTQDVSHWRERPGKPPEQELDQHSCEPWARFKEAFGFIMFCPECGEKLPREDEE